MHQINQLWSVIVLIACCFVQLLVIFQRVLDPVRFKHLVRARQKKAPIRLFITIIEAAILYLALEIVPPNKLGVKENDQVRPDRADCRLFNGTVFLSVNARQTLFYQCEQWEYSSSGNTFLRRTVMPSGGAFPRIFFFCVQFRFQAPFLLKNRIWIWHFQITKFMQIRFCMIFIW